jgi:hypothetical protein
MRFIHTFQLYHFLDTLVSLLTAFVFGTPIGAERQYMSRGSKNPAGGPAGSWLNQRRHSRKRTFPIDHIART